MTSEDRRRERDTMLRALRQRVSELNGDISDGIAILAVAFMELHAAECISSGQDEAAAKAEAFSAIDEFYAEAYTGVAHAIAAEARTQGLDS